MSHNLNQLLSDFTQKPFALQETLQVFKDILVQIFPQIHFSTPHTQELNGTLKSYTTFATPLKLGNDELGVAIFECESIKAKIGIHTELKSHLKDSLLNAILAIFYTTDSSEFRLSLITKTYNLDTDKLVFSNLKRQSFVLGQPKVATAHNALKNLIHSAKKSQITLKDLESAFSQEAISKEFYAQIITHYFDFLQGITFPSEASEYTQRSFALRLLSRILFCKFLEKKKIISENLWDTALSADYYHEVLEPLFFTTLNTPQDLRDYALLPRQIVEILSKIPYLNGGLFSPQQNDFYAPSYINTLTIPNTLFDNLFALLNRYSFTLDEYSHNDEEVSLNPELLGTIFESLLSQLFTDNKLEKLDKNSLRKATGSYYTPREIVRYMVRSAILLHLQTHLKGKVDSAYLQSLVFEDFAYPPSLSTSGDKRSGDFAKSTPNFCHTEGEARSIPTQSNRDFSHFANVQNDKSKQHRDISPAAQYDKPSELESKKQSFCHSEGAIATEESKYILDSLSTLKILDPACGSGAFPMGILSEIIRLQDLLGDTRPHYARKLEILQNCIYGVDIQPMATEIARLRCFLSLIVDESPSDIKPLPNLEFKFISANSLLPLPKDDTLQYDGYVRDMAELESLRTKYFNPDSSESKAQIQKEYTTLRTKIANKVSATNAQEALENPLLGYDPFNPHSTAQFFDSTYMFGIESFDILIGNPPYIRGQNIPNKEAISKSYVDFACGSADIYTYFFAKGFELLKQKGTLSYIVSNKFTKASYGQNLRNLILQNQIVFYVDCDGVKIFENASVDPCIISISKTKPIHTFSYSKVASLQDFANDICANIQKIPQQNLNPKFFSFEPQSKSVDLAKKLKSFELKFSQIAQIAKGSSSGNDDVFLFDFVLESKKLYKVKNDFGEFELEKDLLQPFVYGEDIRRYEYCKRATYILYPYDNQNALIKANAMGKKYPLIYQYLQDRKSLLMQRKIKLNDDDFYKFSAIRNPHTYKKSKVMIPDLLNHSRFGFDNVGFYHNASIHNVCLKQGYENLEKMILGVLNSRLFWFFIRHSSANLGSATRLMPSYLNDFSFPKIDSNNQDLADEIGSLVDRTLESKSQNKDTNELERQIDELVYKLYNLIFDEVTIIESWRKV